MHRRLANVGPSDRNTIASGLLDLLRFSAAVTVVVYHTASFANLTSPARDIVNPVKGFITYVVYQWTTAGYQAVMVFFVLSGYLIGSNVLRSMSKGTWSWRTYAIGRLTRLYVVLIPALALTALFAKVQLHIFGPVWYFKGDLTWKVLLGNLAFLQDIGTIEFGGNGPLWSLSFEFWYYLMFPLLALIFYGRRPATKIWCALSLGALAVILGWDVARYFLVWLLGAGAAFLPALKIQARKYRHLVVVFVLILAIESLYVPYHLAHVTVPTYTSPNPQFLPDLCVGLTFALLIKVIVGAYGSQRSALLTRLFAYLAGFSYTLYLTHYPVLHFLFAWQASGNPPFVLRRFVYIGPIALGSTLMWAWLVSRIFECKTGVVRQWLLSKTKRTYGGNFHPD